MALAVGALNISLILVGDQWWLLSGFVLTFVLLRNGLRRERDANDLLLEAVAVGVLSPVSINRYKGTIHYEIESAEFMDATAGSDEEASTAGSAPVPRARPTSGS